MIPTIIHQIWWQGLSKISPEFKRNISLIKNNHKQFEYIFWDEIKINKLIDEKYNDYTSLIFTPKYIKLLTNQTNVSDEKVLDYICNVVFKEENEKTRERNNTKRREKYEAKKIYG